MTTQNTKQKKDPKNIEFKGESFEKLSEKAEKFFKSDLGNGIEITRFAVFPFDREGVCRILMSYVPAD